MSADEYWKAHPELAHARYGDAYYARPLADMQRVLDLTTSRRGGVAERFAQVRNSPPKNL
jgi:hypothetical protein